jgi:hypothetical protein
MVVVREIRSLIWRRGVVRMENQSIQLDQAELLGRNQEGSITVTHGCGERVLEDQPPNKSTWPGVD